MLHATEYNIHIMSKIKGVLVIDKNRCKGCGLCVVACPTKTLALSTKEVNHKGYAFCEEIAETRALAFIEPKSNKKDTLHSPTILYRHGIWIAILY